MAFSGLGAGTPADPYQITSYSQLKEMADTLGASYILMNDINASGSRTELPITGSPGEYYGWAPIGNSSAPFTGSFDGDGFKITGLYINRYDDTSGSAIYNGLIGVWQPGATALALENVSIIDAEIHSGDTNGCNTGILVGYANGNSKANTTIENVDVSGKITIENTGQHGGLGGRVNDATITDCNSDVQIDNEPSGTMSPDIGGMVGLTEGCDWVRCQSSGTIALEYDAIISFGYWGGFAGEGKTATNSFTDCKAIVSITVNIKEEGDANAYLYIGGFYGSGYNASAPSGTFVTCRAEGNIATTGSASIMWIGGFGGALTGSATECAASGNIISGQSGGTFAAGGFEGGHLGTMTFVDCYASGDVCAESLSHSTASLGGFSGGHGAHAGTEFTRCYSVGEVNKNTSNGGGFVGYAATSPTCTNCFWDTETSGWITSFGTTPTGKTTAEMKASATFTNFDFTEPAVWFIPNSVQPATIQSNLTVWPSRSGDYENFDAGTDDDSAFVVTIPSTNEIRWVESMEGLLIGTAGDEWNVASNKLNTPLSPTNFGVKQQSNYGSTNVQPVKINEVILYADFVKRKIRELTFSADKEKYVSPDLSSLAEHITLTGIVNMAHQKNPDSILWCVLTDGSLIGMVYDREQNIVAWFDCPIDGVVQSVCVTPGTSEDEVWLSVQRTLDGDTIYYEGEEVYWEEELVTYAIGTVVYIEKMGSRYLTALTDCFFVDSGITFTATTPTATITGLSHIIGETVQVLGDGVILDEAVVDEDGQITAQLDGVDVPVSKAQVGLQYTSLLQPMRIAPNGPDGISLGSITHVPELTIVFLDTLAAKYGNSESELYEVDFSDPALEDAAYITGLFSGDVTVNMPGSFSVQNPLIVSTAGPGPLNVKAIIASFDQTG